MFNKIKKSKPVYFIDRLVEGFEELDGMVKITFKEGEPKTEHVTKAEWDAGNSKEKKDKPHELQESFVKRTADMRREIAKVFFSKNPRHSEIPKVFIWVQEGLKEAYEAAVSKSFGVENFERDITIDHILKKLEENNVKIDEGLDETEKELLNFIRTHDVRVWSILTGQFGAKVIEKIKDDVDKAVDIALGTPSRALRVDDIEKIINHEQNQAKQDDVPKEQSEQEVPGSGEQGEQEPEEHVDGV